ncbi:MAG: hypothetical protein ACJAVK_000269 [Akkermansiaceae bacterium]|jgi:hypothetical protein
MKRFCVHSVSFDLNGFPLVEFAGAEAVSRDIAFMLAFQFHFDSLDESRPVSFRHVLACHLPHPKIPSILCQRFLDNIADRAPDLTAIF